MIRDFFGWNMFKGTYFIVYCLDSVYIFRFGLGPVAIFIKFVKVTFFIIGYIFIYCLKYRSFSRFERFGSDFVIGIFVEWYWVFI